MIKRRKKILVICPGHRDYRELQQPAIEAQYDILFHEDEAAYRLESFDPLAYLENTLKEFQGQRIDGLFSSDDYPGCSLASILAHAWDLPSATPEAVLLCQHKYHCREAQKQCVPQAVPDFALLDPSCYNGKPPLEFPFFVKPVKSFFSMGARRVENARQLEDVLTASQQHLTVFCQPFQQLLRNHSSLKLGANYLLCEQLLEGDQVTLEGFVYNQRVETLGIVDSFMYPGTICFERFQYPSALKQALQDRMSALAERLMKHIGFHHGIFNIEMMYNRREDRIYVIEVNPRMVSQFADLFEKVDGTSTYEIQLALATGKKPKRETKAGRYSTAASFVWRTFQDKKILKVPNLEEVQSRLPDARIEIFGEVGERLSEYIQDGMSYRYAIVNLGGQNEDDLRERYDECKQLLEFRFASLKGA